jgi:signal transduction histidine kinase
MDSLIDQVLALLSSDAGNLTYHLVLAFSIASALQIAFIQNRRVGSIQFKRVQSGVAILLAFQIVLFVFSGLVWQGVLSAQPWLPLLERSLYLLNLIILVWLWCFPKPDASVDAAWLSIGLLAVFGCIFGSLWWYRQGTGQMINGSIFDIILQSCSIAIAVSGLLILIIRQPLYWGYGFVMLALLGVGSAAHMLLLPYGQDYPTITRLFEIAAYPILLLLPLRASQDAELGDTIYHIEDSEPVDELDASLEAGLENEELMPESSLWKPLLALMQEVEPDQVCKKTAAILAHAAGAELSLIASPPDLEGMIHVMGGYDGRNNRFVKSATLDSAALPNLVSSLKMGRVRRIASNNTSPDILFLRKAYDMEYVGNILMVPVLQPDGKPFSGIILASGNENTDWTIERQSFISALSKLLVYFLQRTQEGAALRSDLKQARQAHRLTQDQAKQAIQEKQRLRDQIAVLKESKQHDLEQITRMASLLATEEILRSTIAQLEVENTQLRDSVQKAQEEDERKDQPVTGELRLALEEISILRSMVEEAEFQIAQIKSSPPEGGISSQQIAAIQAIAQDLRQPLSSIIGYTDVLLSETIGTLGGNQKKYLQRIKLSTERFGRLVDDLVQVSLVESNPNRIEQEEFDVREAARSAIKECEGLIQVKRQNMKTQVPENPLPINSDRKALHRLLFQLIQNASSATPEGGELELLVRHENADNELDYILIQVSDQGEGIKVQDLPKVFTPRSEPGLIPGLGKDGVDFLRMKTLVETLNGRIWVDSELGSGSTFSLLLPSRIETNELGIEVPL